MSECTVRIKNKKTGDHLMVTPAYAARTKMLKNSGWVVEDLPEQKTTIIEYSSKDADSFDEALTEKETGLTLDQQQPQEENQEVKTVEPTARRRGRQPGSTNKNK